MAAYGVYNSREAYTDPMKKEAAGAGLCDGPTGKVPKIQVFTIEELLAGKKDTDPADGARLQGRAPRGAR